jgi:hypothetical protein
MSHHQNIQLYTNMCDEGLRIRNLQMKGVKMQCLIIGKYFMVRTKTRQKFAKI